MLPPPPPQSPKAGAGRGGGGADRTVMQMLGWLGGLCCHATACSLCSCFPPRRGKCCPFFFSVWFGVFCRFFAALLFLGSLFGKISGANFCFWFLLRFLFLWFGGSLPKMFGKFFLMSGLFLWARSLFFKVFCRRRFGFLCFERKIR